MSIEQHDHDDGLVHSHGWATDTAPHVEAAVAARAVLVNRPSSDTGHDDGLVHGHNWACSERGRLAHERG